MFNPYRLLTRDSLIHKAVAHEMRVSAQVFVLIALGIHRRLQEVWQRIGCYPLSLFFDQSITVDISVTVFISIDLHLKKIKPTMNEMMLELPTWWAITLCPSRN